MSSLLEGRVALITGAGTGLGRAHALLFASLGARIVVNDLGGSVAGDGASRSAADSVVDEIKTAGGQAVADYGSVTDPAAAAAMVQKAVDAFGRIDIVVNNAGILRDKTFAKMQPADFEEVVRVHLFGAFNVTHAAWPLMQAQQYGRIVMTTSSSGTNGNFAQANYAAAKLGLVGMMNCLALEGRKRNVLINAISPAALTRMTENIPIGDVAQYLKAELVSPAAAWLASDACTLSGTIISAGGGFYSNVKYFEGSGVQFDPVNPVTVEMFSAAADRILSLEAAKPVQPGPLGELEPRLIAMGRLQPQSVDA